VFRDLIELLFPNHCQNCERSLFKHEKTVCTHCKIKLPKTIHSKEEDEKIKNLLWGPHSIIEVITLYQFEKNTSVQLLLHKLKYKGKKSIGIFFGQELAKEIQNKDINTPIDLIIPVPLHAKKVKKRGYNQTDIIAQGIEQELGLPIDNKLLKRVKHTTSQTSKSVFDRWKNVSNSFELNHPEKLCNKHIILIDDVITTGATLRSCIEALAKVDNIKISVGIIAQS